MKRMMRCGVAMVESLEGRQFLSADVGIHAASTTNLASNGNKAGNVTLKNKGTVTLNGPVVITFLAKPAGGGDVQTLGSKTVTLSKLKPNAAKGFSQIKLKVPTGTGKFNISVKITPAEAMGDSVAGNNVKAVGSVTIKK